MFIAMNRFKIILGCESDFEDVWRNRESHLDEVDGFLDLILLKCNHRRIYSICIT